MRIVLACIVTLFLGYLGQSFVLPWLEMQEERFVLLERRLDIQEKELGRIKNEIAEMRMDTSVRHSGTEQSPSLSERDPVVQRDASVNVDRERESLELAARMSMIEGIVALSEQERQAIQTALREAEGSELSDDVLREIFGEDRFLSFQRERAVFEERVREEVVDREVFSLRTLLNLSPEQEADMRKIIIESRERFMPRRGTPSWDEVPQGVKERTRYRLLQEEARQQFLSTEAGKVLTEVQLNLFLENQASSVSRRSHTSFLNALGSSGEGAEER